MNESPIPPPLSSTTETRNPRTTHIDEMSTLDMLRLINELDHEVPRAVARTLPQISEAVERIVTALESGGRLIYMGAGTSGRLGILDASECPPTYGTPESMVKALIAGGHEAILRAREGAEDDAAQGAADLDDISLSNRDVVVGLAASGTTPYVMGGLKRAIALGAGTVAISCNPGTPMLAFADIGIVPVVGPEAVTGSTRMKAGTAQKLVLNMLTTGTMIRLGKTYGNLMVDMRATNDKLKERALRMVSEVTGLTKEEAAPWLNLCEGECKPAIYAALTHSNADDARQKLAVHGGRLSLALKDAGIPDRRG